jgi:hypothetical protein
MAKMIFPLGSVPDDEADAIRLLLEQNQIAYYETDAGNWGISFPGIWLQNDSDWDHAKEVIRQYQLERELTAKHDFATRKARGENTSLFARFSERPVKTIFYLLLTVLILYLSVQPFLALL